MPLPNTEGRSREARERDELAKALHEVLLYDDCGHEERDRCCTNCHAHDLLDRLYPAGVP